MAYCETENTPVLRDDCRTLAETYKLILAKKNQTFKEPIDGSDVVDDVTNIDTYQDRLESGAIQILEITPTDLTAPEFLTGTLGNDDIALDTKDPVYLFHVKSNDDYQDAMNELEKYRGGYIAYIQRDDTIQAWKDTRTSATDLKMLRIEDIKFLGKSPMNNSQDVPMYIVRVRVSQKQNKKIVTRKFDFDADILEQKKVIADGDITIVSNADVDMVVTDETSSIFTSDYSGTTGDGNVSVTLDDFTVIDSSYTVVSGVLTIEEENQDVGVVAKVTIENDAPFYDNDYYSAEVSAVTIA